MIILVNEFHQLRRLMSDPVNHHIRLWKCGIVLIDFMKTPFNKTCILGLICLTKLASQLKLKSIRLKLRHTIRSDFTHHFKFVSRQHWKMPRCWSARHWKFPRPFFPSMKCVPRSILDVISRSCIGCCHTCDNIYTIKSFHIY